jgi:hypothetical protein
MGKNKGWRFVFDWGRKSSEKPDNLTTSSARFRIARLRARWNHNVHFAGSLNETLIRHPKILFLMTLPALRSCSGSASTVGETGRVKFAPAPFQNRGCPIIEVALTAHF